METLKAIVLPFYVQKHLILHMIIVQFFIFIFLLYWGVNNGGPVSLGTLDKIKYDQRGKTLQLFNQGRNNY